MDDYGVLIFRNTDRDGEAAVKIPTDVYWMVKTEGRFEDVVLLETYIVSKGLYEHDKDLIQSVNKSAHVGGLRPILNMRPTILPERRGLYFPHVFIDHKSYDIVDNVVAIPEQPFIAIPCYRTALFEEIQFGKLIEKCEKGSYFFYDFPEKEFWHYVWNQGRNAHEHS